MLHFRFDIGDVGVLDSFFRKKQLYHRIEVCDLANCQDRRIPYEVSQIQLLFKQAYSVYCNAAVTLELFSLSISLQTQRIRVSKNVH